MRGSDAQDAATFPQRGDGECQPQLAWLFPSPWVQFLARAEMGLSRSAVGTEVVRPLAIRKAMEQFHWRSRMTPESKQRGWSGQVDKRIAGTPSPARPDTGPLDQQGEIQRPPSGHVLASLVGQNIQVRRPLAQPLSWGERG